MTYFAVTTAEAAQNDRLVDHLRSRQFIEKLAISRIHMREAAVADLIVKESEMAEMLSVDPSVVRVLLAFIDAWDTSQMLIDIAEMEAVPTGVPN